MVEALVISRLGFSGERLLGKMVHAEEVVVGRTYVAAKRVALEQQILHILRDTNGDFVDHLGIACFSYIEPLRRREQKIRRYA